MSERSPDLSVVIPSVNGWKDLRGALAALARQTGGCEVEVIVIDRVGPSVREPLRREYPQARLIEVDATVTIPMMRAAGFAVCRAAVVGVIEDHVIVPPDWAQRMLAAHGAGAVVVGGSVANAACDRLVDWAAFLCEYSHCLEPQSGSAKWLMGNNVTYRRELLARFRATIEEGRWEDHLHDELRRSGVPLLCRPDIVVGHKKHYSIGEYLQQRYLYARAFAGMRLEAAGRLRRLGYGGAALLLPGLLFYRIVSRVRGAQRHGRELLRSLPLLALFVSAWAAGEVVGSWRGPGDTLARVC